MVYTAHMPEIFWAEAVVTAPYVWNRLPSTAIDNNTPYELWFNRPPAILERLHPFGCIVYIHVPKARCPKGSKLHPRASRGCFIGYQSGNYKCWDLDKKTFVVTHDVLFKENEFPMANDFDSLGIPAASSSRTKAVTKGSNNLSAPLQTPLSQNIPVHGPTMATELPILHDTIIVERPPTGYIFAVTLDGDHKPHI